VSREKKFGGGAWFTKGETSSLKKSKQRGAFAEKKKDRRQKTGAQ